MAPRPRLGQLFLPERQYKLTGTAAPLILRALFEAGDRHDQHRVCGQINRLAAVPDLLGSRAAEASTAAGKYA